MIIYAMGDIHGSSGWMRVYEKFRSDPSRDKKFIFLGDLIDDKSLGFVKQVTDYKNLENLHLIRDVIVNDPRTYLCLGNHDVAKILKKSSNIVEEREFKKNWESDEKYRTMFIRIQSAYRNMIKNAPGRVGIAFKFGSKNNSWIFSHAGISYLDKSPTEYFNKITIKNYKNELNKLNSYTISPIWTRLVHLRAIPNCNQVVGHTPTKVIGKNTIPLIIPIQDESGYVIYIDDSLNGSKTGIRINTSKYDCSDITKI